MAEDGPQGRSSPGYDGEGSASSQEGGPGSRAALTRHWQAAALDLIERGLPPADVFETLVVVGLAGLIETRGKRDATHRLLRLAEQLTDQIKREAAAVDEARRATKN